MEHRQTYSSYLLRMWQVYQQDHWTWRCQLRCVATGETHGFPDLESLVLFLREQAPCPPDRPFDERGTRDADLPASA
jgi:hypothetical protein